jgi:hypothetical protein
MDGNGYCYDYVVGWEDEMDGKWGLGQSLCSLRN